MRQFLVEMGDETRLATIGLAGRYADTAGTPGWQVGAGRAMLLT